MTADQPPQEEPESIWSTILQNVSSSKNVFQKNILVLGDPNGGKSSLVQFLKRDHKELLQVAVNGAAAVAAATSLPSINLSDDKIEHNELALSYTYANVKDDDNEDTIARIGLYQMAASHSALLPYALNANTFVDTMVVICLDWQRPWTFVETLLRWFKVIEEAVNAVRNEGREGASGWSKGGVVVDDAKEKLERFLQEYNEPPSDGVAAPPPTTGGDEVLLPLTEGALQTNFGVPIAVVCCKSDVMNLLEKEQDYKEDQFDYIQQTLRSICLRYGAALFYCSTHRPRTFALLRAYMLHRLMGHGAAGANLGTRGGKPASSLFQYNFKAQVVERDVISVPSGWDTWGKIQVLREGFECRKVLDAWESDWDKVPDEGLRKSYETLIRDSSVGIKPTSTAEEVIAEDDQMFLGRYLEILKKAATEQATITAAPSNLPPIVSNTNLPTKAFETPASPVEVKEDEDVAAKLAKLARATKPSAAAAAAAGAPEAAAAAGPDGQSQNEVLTNFFQSLLVKKNTATNKAQRKKATEELDKMRKGGQ